MKRIVKTTAKDVAGLRFGRLVAVSPTAKRQHHGAVVWACICDCGNTCEVSIWALKTKNTQSCGCLKKDAHKANGARNRTHGLANSPTKNVYRAMLARCYRPGCNGYQRYGGVGVTVCERWMAFANFVEDMGVRPPGTTIDRIDNSKGYEPGNCRWATHKEQARNKRSNRIIEHEGKKQPLIAWAEEYGIRKDTLRWRLESGMPVAVALTKPVLKRRSGSVDADGEPVNNQENES